jgi:acetylglutamate kinase
MQQLTERVATLVEALPYIRKWAGKIVVIKYGGNAMADDELKRQVALDCILLHYVGIRPVVVHGGGPKIDEVMSRVGKKSVRVAGLRVTDQETMEIAQMVLVGTIQQELVSLINANGGRAVGLSGKDANLIVAAKKDMGDIDLGFVGEVISVDRRVIDTLLDAGYIVVISSIGVGIEGESYNINADTVAGDLAAALDAEKLLVLSDVPGILDNVDDPDSLISRLTLAEAEALMTTDKIGKGMIPKVEACTRALQGGVPRAHLIDGRVPHSIIMELFTDAGIGTMIEGVEGER